ncbi:MAG: hypothetical protein ACK4S2_15325 [Gemmobacter sp.]|uniref:hypothetical protein n=1 Tax=Gemmobacter sp. TaxID=1898957 RepID=UPI00391CC151
MTAVILDLLLPHLLELASGLLALAIGWAAMRFNAWTGIQIEARHREALHAALMTGARAAVSRGLPVQQAVDLAVGHAQASVPAAMKRLKPSEPVLRNLARAKVAEATQAAPGPGDR